MPPAVLHECMKKKYKNLLNKNTSFGGLVTFKNVSRPYILVYKKKNDYTFFEAVLRNST